MPVTQAEVQADAEPQHTLFTTAPVVSAITAPLAERTQLDIVLRAPNVMVPAVLVIVPFTCAPERKLEDGTFTAASLRMSWTMLSAFRFNFKSKLVDAELEDSACVSAFRGAGERRRRYKTGKPSNCANRVCMILSAPC